MKFLEDLYYSTDYMYSDVQTFPKGIIKPYEGTILTTGTVRFVQYLLVVNIFFSSHLATRVKD